MEFNEQRFHKINLWIGATLLALSVLFLILGVTTAHGEENATVPPQEEVTPQKALPPGYSSGVHFRAVKSVCGPQSGLVAILNTKKMEPVFRGAAVQNYMFNGGETPIKMALFINKQGEFAIVEWLGEGIACINILGSDGQIALPSYSKI